MTDRVPSAKALKQIRLRALADIYRTRQLRDAEHRGRGFAPRDRSAEAGEAVKEYQRTGKAWQAARDRLASFLSDSGGMTPWGWPESVSSTLDKIAAMLEWDLDFIFDAPDEMFTAFEEEIDSLAAVATDASSRKDARELARDGYRHVTSGDLDDMEVSRGRLEDRLKRAVRQGKIVDWAFDTDDKAWVTEKKTGD